MKSALLETGGAESGALAEIIDAWPDLPEPTRQAIVAIVQAARASE